MSRVAILSALPEELDQIARAARLADRRQIGGVEFISGELEGHAVVLALSGVGKVNAAFAATIMLDRFACEAVIFSGVAGSLNPDLAVGDLLVADRLVQHDYGAMVDGEFWPSEPGRFPAPGATARHEGYALPPALARELAALIAGVRLPACGPWNDHRPPTARLGAILTGDMFLSCGKTRQALRAIHGGDAIEMEGAAVAQVAAKFGVPCVAIRTISDAASADSFTDFEALVHVAAANSAAMTRAIIPVVARGL